jgi:hypothetical protein
MWLPAKQPLFQMLGRGDSHLSCGLAPVVSAHVITRMQRPERSRTEQPHADSALRPLPQSDTTLHTIEANHALNVKESS